MKFVLRFALFAAFLTLPLAIPASAQYMYMDANGNGIHDAGDRLNANNSPTVVDIYLDTTHNRDGSAVDCNSVPGTLMQINSYVVSMVAANGTVTYGNYVNQASTQFPNPGGEVNAGDGAYKNAFFSFSYSPPGLYRLGTVTITGTGGSPRIDLVDQLAGVQDFTSFGTLCPGKLGDNTYRLDGPNTRAFYEAVGLPPGTTGDWFDNDGVAAVAGGNNPPVITNPGNKTTAESANLAFTVTATDPDAGQTVSYSLTLGTPAATGATINATTGAFSWTPTEVQGPGVYPVTVTAEDNVTPVPGTASAGFSITVTEANQAPILSAIGDKTVTVNQALSFTAAATDPDIPANGLAFSLAGAPAGATIISTSGIFSWTPTSTGAFPLTVVATDNGTPPLSDSEGITITVNPGANQPPVLAAIGNKSVNELVALTFTATATDPDAGQTLAFSLDAGAPPGAAINATTGAFSWTPTEAQGPGSYPVTIRVTDNAAAPLSDFEAISITVNEVNSAPVLAAIGNKTGTVGTPVTFTATATDADIPANTLTFSLDAGAPAGATINGSTGLFSWTPTASGTFPLTVRVTDNGTPALNDFEAITIDVSPAPNTAPVLGAIGNKTVNELSALTFTATANDADAGQTLTFSLDAGAPAGAAITALGAFSWTPTEAQGPGSYPVTIRVTDNGSPALSDFEVISVTVNEVNVAPVLAAIGSKTATVGTELTFTATATDADLPPNTLSFSLDAGAPAGAAISATTGVFSWTPGSGQVGNNSVTVRVTDNGTPAMSDFEAITINVSPAPNTPPVLAAIGNKTLDEGSLLTFTATATDADASQTLTFSLDAGAPAGAVINGTSGVFTWQPIESDGPGVHPITVRVTDNGTPPLSDFELISVTVNEVNLAPVLNAIGNKTVDEGVNLNFTATATDADLPPNTLTFSLGAGAPAGAVINAGGTFSWSPTEAQGPGSYPVTIRVTDNGTPALSDFEAISITVNEVNVAPVLAGIGNKAGTVGVEVAFTATATDADLPANTLAFSLDAGAPAGATINGTTGAFSWTPSANGDFPVTVRVTDNGAPPLSDFEAISISVSAAPNQEPVLAAIGNKTVDEEAQLAFTATATDADAGQTLTFSLDAGAPAGAAITAGGAFSWTPTEAQGGTGVPYPITVRVTDDGTPNLSDTEAIMVTVNEVNVAPVLAAIGSKAGTVGVEIAFTAAATDADIPANTLAFSLDAGVPAGATISATTGAFSWTPSASGSFAVTVRVTDSGTPALSDFEAITIDVTGAAENQPPVLAAIGNKTVDEETELAFTATATDADAGQTSTFSLDAPSPAGATINGSTGAFSWTPTEAQGPAAIPITVRVTDNGSPALSDFETIAVAIAEVNVAPVLAAIGNKAGTVGVEIAFIAAATDADIPANTLTFSLDAGAPAGATINGSTGAFSWTPSASGSFAVTVRATDNGTPALSDFEAITIDVTQEVVNHAPVLDAIGNKTVDEETLLTFTATATDPDNGQTLAFSLGAGEPSGAVITAAGVFSWTPAEIDGPGVFTVLVRVTDDGSPTMDDSELIHVTVNEVNLAPALTPIGNKSGVAGSEISFKATATDADIPTNEMTFSVDAGAPTGVSMDPNTGDFTWTPSAGGDFTVVVRVTDNGVPARDDFEEITIHVTEEGLNHPPVLDAIGDKTVDEGALLSFTATATDPDAGQTLTFDLGGSGFEGMLMTPEGVFTWTPGEMAGGDAPLITVRVTDNGSPPLTDTEDVRITINETNVAPVLAAIGDKTVTAGALLTFTATATDADLPRNTLTFSLDAGSPAGAAIGATSGVFTWTPGSSGSFPVTVRVTDNGIPSLDDFEAITITVNAVVNHPPTLNGVIGNQTVDEGHLLGFSANAGDPDVSQNLAFSLDPGAPAGAAIDANGNFSWIPTEGQGPGSYPITVRVTDNGIPPLSDFEAITITVNEVNVAPVLAGIGNKSGTVGVAITFTATATDADIPANTLTFSLDAGAPAGATINGSTGAFSWTPSATGTFSATVRVTDNGTPALSDFETIAISVSGGTETLAAHAFFVGPNLVTVLDSKDKFTCSEIEPVHNSYSNDDVDLSSIVMMYAGKQITASAEKTKLDGDKNDNGVKEITACFSKGDLRYLFSDLSSGLHKVEVTIEGNLESGARFHDTVNHFVIGTGTILCRFAASPNPLNPETVLSFITTQVGPVTVRVFDIKGRLVKTLQNGVMPAGLNSIRWDGSADNGSRVATGIYFAKLNTLDGEDNLRLTVLK